MIDRIVHDAEVLTTKGLSCRLCARERETLPSGALTAERVEG